MNWRRSLRRAAPAPAAIRPSRSFAAAPVRMWLHRRGEANSPAGNRVNQPVLGLRSASSQPLISASVAAPRVRQPPAKCRCGSRNPHAGSTIRTSPARQQRRLPPNARTVVPSAKYFHAEPAVCRPTRNGWVRDKAAHAMIIRRGGAGGGPFPLNRALAVSFGGEV